MHRRAGLADGQLPPGRRPAALLIVGLIVVAIVALLAIVPLPGVSAGVANANSPDPSPPTTVDDFLPENQNLGDCLGTLERPGCGSEGRGGWRQTLVFVVMGVGLAIVFGRIAWAVRRTQRT